VFDVITRHVEEALSVTVDRVVAAQLRQIAWVESDPAMNPTAGAVPTAAALPRPQERYLDAEFVAIYW
jgi:hypothetical protein